MFSRRQSGQLLVFAAAHAFFVSAASNSFANPAINSGTPVFTAGQIMTVEWQASGFSAFNLVLWQATSGDSYQVAAGLTNQSYLWPATISYFSNEPNEGHTEVTTDLLHFQILDPKNMSNQFLSGNFKVEGADPLLSSTSTSLISSTATPSSQPALTPTSTSTSTSTGTNTGTNSTVNAQDAQAPGLRDAAKVGLGVGLGLGIPLVAGIVYIAFLLRQRQRQERQYNDQRQHSMQMQLYRRMSSFDQKSEELQLSQRQQHAEPELGARPTEKWAGFAESRADGSVMSSPRSIQQQVAELPLPEESVYELPFESGRGGRFEKAA